MSYLSLRVLGTCVLHLEDQRAVRFPTDKAQALLVYVALQPERPFTRELLAGLLWPDITDASAFTNLRQTLYRLRKMLDPLHPGISDALFLSTRQTISLAADVIDVDRITFERLLAVCATHQHAALHTCDACLERLEEAVELYGGELLAGFGLADAPAFEEWLLIEREIVSRHFRGALRALATAYELRGAYERAHLYATRFLHEDPLREDMHRQVMRLLARQGLIHQAIAQYDACCRILAAELGVQPEAATTTLAEQIRSGTFRNVEGDTQQGDVIPTPTAPLASSSAVAVPASSRHDWGDMPSVDRFHGRERELTTLEQWIVQEQCRVVTLLGMGGVGKTSLAATSARHLADQFDLVIWRSLVNAPPLDELLRGWFGALAAHTASTLPDTLDDQMRLLLEHLRHTRCLLVLDNLESILQPGNQAGAMRAGYEGYAQLIERIGVTTHRSCLLLTSREQPQALARLIGSTPAVQLLPLQGLDVEAGHALLQLHGLAASGPQASALVAHYSGNPLALQIVANTIADLFGGDIDAFEHEEIGVFDTIRHVLDEQFARLSDLEQEILFWLAIERAPIPLATLHSSIVQPVAPRVLLEAAQGLHKRSLLEKSGDGLMLQHVVTEYLTDRLIDEMCAVLIDSDLDAISHSFLNRYALIKAQSKEYVRQSQVRLILDPVAKRVLAALGKARFEQRMARALTQLRGRIADQPQPGYAGGNLLNLALHLNVDMTGYDFSSLSVWQVDLRGKHLARVSFAHAHIANTIFTGVFGVGLSIAFRPDGTSLAVGLTNGEVHLWRVPDAVLERTIPAHRGFTAAVAWSHDSRWLVSGGHDNIVQVYDLQQAAPRFRLAGHTNNIQALACAPNTHIIASGGKDLTIRLWDMVRGRCVAVLRGHTDFIRSLAFSPDGTHLFSASQDHTIRVWDVQIATCVAIVDGHTGPVLSVAVDESGRYLASCGHDRSVRVWDAATFERVEQVEGFRHNVRAVAFRPPLHTGSMSDTPILAIGAAVELLQLWTMHERRMYPLYGHTLHVDAIAFHPTGTLLASSSGDATVCLWDVQSRSLQRMLQGHINLASNVAFSPDGRLLASGHTDHLVRIWDVSSGEEVRYLSGHTQPIGALAWTPDGTIIATGSPERRVMLWDVASGSIRQRFAEQRGNVHHIAISPDGNTLASGGGFGDLFLWDLASGTLRHRLFANDKDVFHIDFSPDGRVLATSGDDRCVRLWDVATGTLLDVLYQHTQEIIGLAFSPTGAFIATGGYDQHIYLWDCEQRMLHHLEGHTDTVTSLAWSPDGRRLASSSHDQTVRVWELDADEQSAVPHRVLQGHTHVIIMVAWSPEGSLLASGSADETVKLWDWQTGECVRTLPVAGPYAGVNITGVTGITEAQKGALKALGAVEM